MKKKSPLAARLSCVHVKAINLNSVPLNKKVIGTNPSGEYEQIDNCLLTSDNKPWLWADLTYIKLVQKTKRLIKK